MQLRNIGLRTETELWRLAYRIKGSRPSSAPYLSGDSFRSLCRHFYEQDTKKDFDPSVIRDGELVFCELWLLREFLEGPSRAVRAAFSVIGHNGDPNVDESITDLLPRNLHRLFTQNAMVLDRRVIALPIGLENKRLHYNGIIRDFERLRRAAVEKRPRILSAYTVGNNPSVRGEALQALSRSPFHDRVNRLNSRAYRKLAAEYMFVASPPGNGTDCHRTWESMYLRVVPVVLESSLTKSFQQHGLPMLVVKSYSEVAEFAEEKLLSTYEMLSPLFESEALWFQYWKGLIDSEVHA